MTTKVQDRTPAASLATVLDALGTDEFDAKTLLYLYEHSRVEHYTMYRLRDGKPEFLGGASIRGLHAFRSRREARARLRSGADLAAATAAVDSSGEHVFLHDDVEALIADPLRRAFDRFQIVDRVILCGRRTDDVYAISLLRSRRLGQFADEELDQLSAIGDVLVSACAKHASIHCNRSRTVRGFESVERIEDTLRASGWRQTERERQVSARILYGVSTIGIALDLGLSAETVATYRKRLYQRLSIGSRHELFRKYLALLS